MSFVSFENIDDLTLDIDDIDYGDKQFVFRLVCLTVWTMQFCICIGRQPARHCSL